MKRSDFKVAVKTAGGPHKVSRASGVSLSEIYHAQSGRRNIGRRTAEALAPVLHLREEQLAFLK